MNVDQIIAVRNILQDAKQRLMAHGAKDGAEELIMSTQDGLDKIEAALRAVAKGLSLALLDESR